MNMLICLQILVHQISKRLLCNVYIELIESFKIIGNGYIDFQIKPFQEKNFGVFFLDFKIIELWFITDK